MAKIIRLTESDLTRLVRRVIQERESSEPEENVSQSCPASVGRLMNKITDNLSDDEIRTVVDVFRTEGKKGFEKKVVNILKGNDIKESMDDKQFKSIVRKIAKIVAFTSIGVMGGITLIIPCFEGVNFFEHPPSWFQDVVDVSIIASIPLSFIAFIAMAMTDDTHK